MGVTEIRETLQAIKEDGYRWLCAHKVTVTPDEDGFTIDIDGEEYGYYSSIREIIPDIRELQSDRPFPRKSYSI
jgi:hypothetical protein